jgi:hypothetical protein
MALARQPDGRLFLEFYIPRMGKRADAVLIAQNIVFVIEFKVGAGDHAASAVAQVEDYALDLKNFHEGSHTAPIVPVLVSTNAESAPIQSPQFAGDLVASPLGTNKADLRALVHGICAARTFPHLDIDQWMAKDYRPTPTIIEAAEILYRAHSVTDISRSDAGAKTFRKQARAWAMLSIEPARIGRKLYAS